LGALGNDKVQRVNGIAAFFALDIDCAEHDELKTVSNTNKTTRRTIYRLFLLTLWLALNICVVLYGIFSNTRK
jgi:hypothetical protein